MYKVGRLCIESSETSVWNTGVSLLLHSWRFNEHLHEVSGTNLKAAAMWYGTGHAIPVQRLKLLGELLNFLGWNWPDCVLILLKYCIICRDADDSRARIGVKRMSERDARQGSSLLPTTRQGCIFFALISLEIMIAFMLSTGINKYCLSYYVIIE